MDQAADFVVELVIGLMFAGNRVVKQAKKWPFTPIGASTMNTKFRNSVIGAAILLLAAAPVWAGYNRGGNDYVPGSPPRFHAGSYSIPKTPELTRASGTSAIALAIGILLLMRERARAESKTERDEDQDQE